MARRTKAVMDVAPPTEKALGGGLEGAERTRRETLNWTPNMGSPDSIINGAKPMADARGRDVAQNDGYGAGIVQIYRDNIVGDSYRLNSRPNWRALGVDQGYAEELQLVLENRFMTVAESTACWLDAERTKDFTMMIRLASSCFALSGEVLATAEWNNSPERPFKTMVQIISPDRLSNKDGNMDTPTLSRGVVLDSYGAPQAYQIRNGYPYDFMNPDSLTWTEVPAYKPWGRKQVMHYREQMFPGQTRGVADMVAALSKMKMTNRFQEITLQNAVINATYAASIESDLPTQQVFDQLGANSNASPIELFQQYMGSYLGMLGQYLDSARNIQIDGAKIPHLFPGTKLNMQPVGTPGGVGTGFEQSLLRHIAAALGISYEEFSRDFSQTNYSSARASMLSTWRTMRAKKKVAADGFATDIFQLFAEEDWNAGNLPLPPGKTKAWLYKPLVKEALFRCSWIGASRGQIDEMKETQAAVLRIQSGLSTYEAECARLGTDFREVFDQASREQALRTKLNLTFDTSSTKPSAQESQSDDQNSDTTNDTNGSDAQ